MNEEQATILIVEDDLDIADMLNAYFRVQGYEVLTVNWGEDGVRACQANLPDLVILDIRLPDIDGFEVAHRLRSNRRTREVPIIFLTEKRERKDRLKGLELKADDYITKPFDIQELRLRVRNVLRRHRQGTLTNPVTGLPEGGLVDEQLGQCLKNPDWSLLVVSISHIDYFREIYGFVASDDLLRAIVLMMLDAIRELGDADDFLGHLTTSDFLITLKSANSLALKDRIQKRLTQSFDYFYRNQDRGSDLFRNRELSVRIIELRPNQTSARDVNRLKAELLSLYR